MSGEVLIGVVSLFIPLLWWIVGRAKTQLEQFITFQIKGVVAEQKHQNEALDRMNDELKDIGTQVSKNTADNAKQDVQIAWLMGKLGQSLESLNDNR